VRSHCASSGFAAQQLNSFFSNPYSKINSYPLQNPAGEINQGFPGIVHLIKNFAVSSELLCPKEVTRRKKSNRNWESQAW